MRRRQVCADSWRLTRWEAALELPCMGVAAQAALHGRSCSSFLAWAWLLRLPGMGVVAASTAQPLPCQTCAALATCRLSVNLLSVNPCSTALPGRHRRDRHPDSVGPERGHGDTHVHAGKSRLGSPVFGVQV